MTFSFFRFRMFMRWQKMRKNFLPLLVASLFLFSCSINSEERSYKGKRAVVVTVDHEGRVSTISGKLKSISHDAIILALEQNENIVAIINKSYVAVVYVNTSDDKK